MPVVTTDTHKPMYLRGLREPRYGFTLGQDGSIAPLDEVVVGTDPALPVDFSMPAPWTPEIYNPALSAPDFSLIPPTDIADISNLGVNDPLVAAGFSASDASLINQAVAGGLLDQSDFQNIVSGQLSPQVIANALQASGASSTVAPDGSANSNDLAIASQMIKSGGVLAQLVASGTPAVLPTVPPATRPSTPYQPPASSQGQNVQLPPGSAPRVGVPVPPALQSISSTLSPALNQLSNALTAQTIPGIPNWLFVVGAGLFLMGGRRSSPRRRAY